MEPPRRPVKFFIDTLTCPIDFEPLFNGVTLLPCAHKINQTPAETYYGVIDEDGTCIYQKPCVICKKTVTSYHADSFIRHLVHKVYSIELNRFENLRNTLTCKYSFEPLFNAVTFIPCCHKINEKAANVLYKEKKITQCFLCNQRVQGYVTDHMIREIAQLYFAPDRENLPIELYASDEIETTTLENMIVFDFQELTDVFRHSDQFTLLENKTLLLKKCRSSVCEKIKNIEDKFQQLIFLFNDLLAPSGKQLCNPEFDPSAIIDICLTENSNNITIYTDKKYTLNFREIEVVTNITTLYNDMVKKNQMIMKLHPGQKLIIKNINENMINRLLHPINQVEFWDTLSQIFNTDGVLDGYSPVFKLNGTQLQCFHGNEHQSILLYSVKGFEIELKKNLLKPKENDTESNCNII